MKNTVKRIGFAVLMTVIALSTLYLAGCKDDDGGGVDTALNGTWFDSGNNMEVKFNNGSFEATGQAKGTYTASGGNFTSTVTHLNGTLFGAGSKWYTKAELQSYGADTYFAPLTGTYTVSGNTLTMTFNSGMFNGQTFNFTKN